MASLHPHPSGPADAGHTLIGEAELTRRRIARALQERQRYRYVKPQVSHCDEGWLITSPCCSRKVAPDGSVIDIARICQEGSEWLLFGKNITRERWQLRVRAQRLEVVLRLLCEDADRVFWP